MTPAIDVTPYVALPMRTLVEFRAELAERLELVGDNGASMIRGCKLREWIAILDEAIERQA
jgi:hypothetical protein